MHIQVLRFSRARKIEADQATLASQVEASIREHRRRPAGKFQAGHLETAQLFDRLRVWLEEREQSSFTERDQFAIRKDR